MIDLKELAFPPAPTIIQRWGQSVAWSSFMRNSPSIVPQGPEQDTYIVLDDFGPRLGRAWRETDENADDGETIIRNLLAGEYSRPVRIACFNLAEGWCRDVSKEMAGEVRQRCPEAHETSESVLA